MKFKKIGTVVSKKNIFEDYAILYMYIAQGNRQITLWDKDKGFATLIMHCKFQRLVLNTFQENLFSIFSPYKYIGTQI